MTDNAKDPPPSSASHKQSGYLAGAGGGLGLGAVVVTGAPWWVFLACLTAGVACDIIRTVFPQESHDRLEWWKARWSNNKASNGTQRYKGDAEENQAPDST